MDKGEPSGCDGQRGETAPRRIFERSEEESNHGRNEQPLGRGSRFGERDESTPVSAGEGRRYERGEHDSGAEDPRTKDGRARFVADQRCDRCEDACFITYDDCRIGPGQARHKREESVHSGKA
jgi:hypothetical protein